MKTVPKRCCTDGNAAARTFQKSYQATALSLLKACNPTAFLLSLRGYFAFPLTHLPLKSCSGNELAYTDFFCRCFSPSWPSLSFTGCAVCRKSGARQVCSESSCQTFRINSLFSIPPTARHAGLCEISSRKQRSLSMLPLLLLNSFGWLERDRTRSAHTRGLPVLLRQLFSGPKHHFCSEQITEGAQLDFPKDIAKAHKA